jgi:hypothetical protein
MARRRRAEFRTSHCLQVVYANELAISVSE